MMVIIMNLAMKMKSFIVLYVMTDLLLCLILKPLTYVLPEEILSEGQVNTNGYLRRYIYIDMVTGECNYNFNIISQGLGE